MKKNYKVKEKNLTKLKSYLKNVIKPISKGSRRDSGNKYNSPQHSHIQ